MKCGKEVLSEGSLAVNEKCIFSLYLLYPISLLNFSSLLLSVFPFMFPKYTSFITQLCLTMQLHVVLLLTFLAFFSLL